MPKHAHIFKVNCCLKVHHADLKLLSSISGAVRILLECLLVSSNVR